MIKAETSLPVIDELRNSQNSSPRMSGSYGGDRKQLFSRHNTSPDHDPSQQQQQQSTAPNPHFSNTRRRSRSLSESGQRVARKLAVPVSVPLICFCMGWYWSSAMSNTLNKTILTSFPYPISLSMVQFALGVTNGLITMVLANTIPRFGESLPRGVVTFNSTYGIRRPTREIILQTAPMGCFQLTGHILSHMSTSLIPVSLVHTIKALSPLFTVGAYRTVFKVRYQPKTYLTLIPLTVGVALTCSADYSAHFLGIIYALLSTLVFVSQNIYSKSLLTPDAHVGNKLDKLNLLCFVSTMAFLFTSPMWLFGEGVPMLKDYTYSRGYFAVDSSESRPLSGTGLLFAFWLNGFVHFCQNLLAFQVLGMVTPVTYSVASLLKRIVVIVVAIFWFGQHIDFVQAVGIVLTFAGLYLYDKFGGDRKQKYNDIKPPSVLPK